MKICSGEYPTSSATRRKKVADELGTAAACRRFENLEWCEKPASMAKWLPSSGLARIALMKSGLS
jgi:hypothetical protein